MANELADIQAKVRAKEVARESVRVLLRRFGFHKRGYHKVRAVSRALADAGLVTVPDFNSVALDSWVTFELIDKGPKPAVEGAPFTFDPRGESATGVLDSDGDVADPTFRMKRLEDEAKQLVTVRPDDPLRKAVTLMMTNDFSQLPVMSGDRNLRGVVSWKTRATKLALGSDPATVSQAMDVDVTTLDSEASFFTAITRIIASDYALIQRSDKTYWIMTTADLSSKFRELSEPFLLLYEIESLLRTLLDERLPKDLIRGARDPADVKRKVESASDLSLGEIIRLIEKPDVWEKLAPRLERMEVVSRLGAIRAIRNDVMHFDPEGLDDSDVATLHAFARFLQDVRRSL